MAEQFYKFKKVFNPRKSTAVSVGDAIEDFLASYRLKTKYNETYVSAAWEKIMGKAIASRTTKIYVFEKKLFLQIDSAPLRNELMIGKSKIVKLVNEDIGTTTILDVVFI
ncbi:MAG: DUF721 domain-containing protein [Pseudarcicella sp.]|nr:DUF721 domain-containing protein [Pseudarcicella sp.]MBP6411246.1 DUF721 domain-containing protein [Pseudarcicella sp.]